MISRGLSVTVIALRHARCWVRFPSSTLFILFTFYILLFIMRPSSLGGGRIMRRTLSVRLSVCMSVRPSRYRYRASRRAT